MLTILAQLKISIVITVGRMAGISTCQNSNVSEVISTFVYKIGMVNSNFGFSTAAGLFQSVVSFVLLVAVNKICKKVTETSLW